jgi:hypothetical protein
MVEFGCTVFVVTKEPLQNHVSLWYMIAAELATCRVPEDPMSTALVGGYVVACMMFFERGIGVPSHRFLHSLLQLYDLELHHLTPSGILHMAAFVTLCDAYMGIEPHFDMWNYSFRARLQQGSDEEAMMLGSEDIFVRSRPRVDPYFLLPRPDNLVRWKKVWFFLRNDADASLPMFTGSCPVLQPKWGYGVAQKHIRRLQPLCDVIQQLL